MQKPINFTKCSSGPIEKNFSLTFGSTSKQTKTFLTKTFYHGPSHRSPSILQAHPNPQHKQFLLESKVEVILISARSVYILFFVYKKYFKSAVCLPPFYHLLIIFSNIFFRYGVLFVLLRIRKMISQRMMLWDFLK